MAGQITRWRMSTAVAQRRSDLSAAKLLRGERSPTTERRRVLRRWSLGVSCGKLEQRKESRRACGPDHTSRDIHSDPLSRREGGGLTLPSADSYRLVSEP